MVRIPLSRPWITEADVKAVAKVLRSRRIANGQLAEKFAVRISELAGHEQGIPVSSGTLGLELALRAIGVKRGDRVACPAYTFVASANAILTVGAKPFWCDVCKLRLTMTVEEAKKAVKAKVSAAVVVDLFGGSACDAGEVFLRAGIPVVQDAAEAIGVKAYGTVAVWAFYANKQITTGEGGVLTTNDDATAIRLARMSNHGRYGTMDGWGTNARMSEMHAALGLSQLARLESILAKRRKVAEWYFADLPAGLSQLTPRPSWFVFPIYLKDMETSMRVANHLQDHGIETGHYFPFIPYFSQFLTRRGRGCPTAMWLSQRNVALPFFTEMTRAQVREVCKRVREAIHD